MNDIKKDDNPLVSILIVVRNEEKYIVECIKSVENQVDDDSFELLIVDGKSEDATVDVAKEYLRKNARYNYKILVNEKRNLAAGWNIGILHAKGRFVVRPDAHAVLKSGYIRAGIQVLSGKPEVGAVGGGLITRSKGFWGSVIKEAMSSRIGVGNSPFRISTSSGYKDTAAYGVYRRGIYEEIGLYNENLSRCQDTEFHGRMRRAGWRFWLDERMKADYYCRDTVSGIIKHMYSNGFYTIDLVRYNAARSVKWRHWAPFGFYSLLLMLFVAGIVWDTCLIAGRGVFAAYLGVVLTTALYKVVNSKKIQNILFFIVVPLMHISYAAGIFSGWCKMIVSKKKQGADV